MKCKCKCCYLMLDKFPEHQKFLVIQMGLGRPRRLNTTFEAVRSCSIHQVEKSAIILIHKTSTVKINTYPCIRLILVFLLH